MLQREKIFSISFVVLLALVPVLAISVPRVLAYIPAVMGVLGFAAYYFVYGQKPVWSRPAFIIMGAMSVLMLLSCLWAIDPDQSFERVSKTVPLLLAGAMLISVSFQIKMETLEPYLRYIPVVLLISAVATCVEIALDYPFYRLIRGDDFDIDVSLSVFNRAIITISLLLVPALAVMRHYYSAQICLLTVLACVIPLLMMGESQSGQLALIVALMTYYLFPYGVKTAWPIVAGVIFALMLALPHIAMWAFSHYAAQIEAVPGLGTGGGYAGARMEIWDYVSRYAMQNPLYGFGVEATRQVTDFGSAEIYQKGKSTLHPHNYTLQLWMEFGAVGVVLGGGLIGWLMLQIQIMPLAQARMALATLFATLSVASMSYGLWQGWWLGLLFIVVVYVILASRLMAQNAHSMTNI